MKAVFGCHEEISGQCLFRSLMQTALHRWRVGSRQLQEVEGIHGEVEGQNLMILVNRDAALNTLEEQGPMEKMHGAAGWEISSLKYFKTSSRMSVCNAARYHVSVYISVYRQYVQSYI